MRRRSTLLLCLTLSLAGSGWGRVLLLWNLDSLPSPDKLGVHDLVIPWNPANLPIFQDALRSHYHIYAQVGLDDTLAAAKFAATKGLSGLIVDRRDESREAAETKLRKLRTQYPKLTFWLLNPNALQPKIRGTLVINHNGILQATSPTAQPWVDTNLALISLERTLLPNQPPVYSFAWELSGAAQKQGPELPDYALAISEAGAFRADMILQLHENLMRGLAQDDPAAWNLWRQEEKYLRFYSDTGKPLVSEANVAVVADDDPSSFEPINLLVRHNIGVRLLPSAKFNLIAARNFSVLVVLSPLTAHGAQAIVQFVLGGGTAVVLNNEKRAYPWESAKQTNSSESSVAYSVGKGRVIELLQTINDPESFAQDIRALIPNGEMQLSLWNALTVIGVMRPVGTNRIIELLNYAADPLEVQVRVKGAYDSITLESPEHGCCTRLTSSVRDGFTEFTVPSLYIAGRVRLEGEVMIHGK